MKYRFITLFVALLMSDLYAETLQAQILVVWQKGGSKVYFNLDEQPKTTFTTNELVITTSTATYNYPLANISRYTYEGGALSVSNTKTQTISITQNIDDVIVTGLPVGKTASVYGVDGKLIIQKRSDGTNRLILSLSDIPAGVYAIKAEEVTYKFTKR